MRLRTVHFEVGKIQGSLTRTALVLALAASIFALAREDSDGPGPVEVQMQNVLYRFTPAITVHIRTLHGHLVSTANGPPVFDDKNSFKLQIASAEIAIPLAS